MSAAAAAAKTVPTSTTAANANTAGTSAGAKNGTASTSAESSPPPPPPLTSLFTHTSQYESHLLTSAQLASQQARNGQSTSSRDVVSPEQATLLQQYYLFRIPLLAKAFGFNERVVSTGMTYFKRYWLGNEQCSVAEPLTGKNGRAWRGGRGVKLVMLISLYLATKTHSSPVSLHSYASLIMSPKPSSTASSDEKAKWEESVTEMEDAIRGHEFQVASVLGWKFRVTHAFEGVRGIALDIQSLPSASTTLPPATLSRIVPLLNTTTAQLRLTDTEFLHTPSQLALGIWTYALREEQQPLRALLDEWIESKTQLDAATTTTLSLDDLKATAANIAQVHIPAAQALERRLKSKETLEEVKAIDLKLKEWIADVHDEDEIAAESKKRKAEDENGNGAAAGAPRKSQRVDSDDESDEH